MTAPGRPSHEGRVLLVALLGPLPAVAVAMLVLLLGDYAPKLRWTLGLVVVIS